MGLKHSFICCATVAVLWNCAAASGEQNAPYFTIRVVDEQTGRGVPLVELKTVNEISFYTDSNGLVAFLEPGLMDQNVFFHVKSHGYAFPKDGFGISGKALQVKPGGEATLKLKRLNVAERLYRITGAGIYRDSVLLGKAVPIQQPVLNAQVLGQDSIQTTEYRGKLYWFWGDTNKAAYPLGHFGTSGATSALPAGPGQTGMSGLLNPDKGIDLTYFADASGFSRKMVAGDEPGMKWIDWVTTVRDAAGAERMVARCAHMKRLEEAHGRTLILFDDKDQIFKTLAKLDLDNDLDATSIATRASIDGKDYIYCAMPYPLLRIPATFEAFQDVKQYETFTCLEPGTRFEKEKSKLQRGADGKVVWGYKKDTASVSPTRQQELIKAGLLKPDEAWYKLNDVESGKPVDAASGTIAYNAFKKRWIMLLCEKGGTSFLGEAWYSEADAPEGPWRAARKVVTHDQYSFYNVVHHPQFDQDGGKLIYFEGTYTHTFSGNKSPTPRYDYNQVMYRLDLSDPRLKLK